MPELTVFSRGEAGPDLWFCADHGEAEAVFALLCEATEAPFRMLAFSVTDWNRDLSPWPAAAVFRGQPFDGQAGETLQWLGEQIEPGAACRVIGGYSLAGLFSLWAFYETGLFRGVASCSGSLWFPGWLEYAQTKSAPRGSALYLSLGEKEPRARNPLMAQVGACTEAQLNLARRQGMEAVLSWHPGGHFQDPPGRVAQGFAWLLSAITAGSR